jgi:hypothetical protein
MKRSWLSDWARQMVLTTIGLEMITHFGKLAERDPELAAVILSERLRKLEARYRALQGK